MEVRVGSIREECRMKYYAHTKDENGKRLPESYWQPLKDHLHNVAKLSEEFGNSLGIGAEAKFAGLLHDLGKYRIEFQQYLRGECQSSVKTQHAVFGAAWAFDCANREDKLAATAFAVAGHHAGLYDAGDLPGFVGNPALSPLETSRELLKLCISEIGPLLKSLKRRHG